MASSLASKSKIALARPSLVLARGLALALKKAVSMFGTVGLESSNISKIYTSKRFSGVFPIMSIKVEGLLGSMTQSN